MKVLVTGGAGFIGSNLVFALIGAGHEVSVIDDLSTGSVGNLDPRATFHRIDITEGGVAQVMDDVRPDFVVHLAAQSSVMESLRDPDRDRAVNVEGTRTVAAAARETGVHRVISASSAAVYGEPETLPLPETARKEPSSPYGSSKLAAEAVLIEELSGSLTDFASLRFSNVYGPRQDALGEGGVVAIFCDRIARGETPVIFGDGAQTRDFIYVGDVVSALICALLAEKPLALEGLDGPAYNVSTGQRTSVEQLLTSLRAVSGFLGPAEHAPAKEGEILHSALDPSKAMSRFGWTPKVPLGTGVAMTWRWFSARPAVK